jgi:collagen triple helix repeat protein
MSRLPKLQPHRSRPLHPRTLALLATPAVIGAMTVAMPALAGTSLGGSTARKASSSHCVTAIVGHRRVRECLLAGSRGPRGFTGAPGPRGFTGAKGATGTKGAAGAKGATGATGPQGIQGVPGTARAYAVVQTTPEVKLIANQSFNITSVSIAAEGVYCITPAASIEASKETIAVSPEVSYTPSGTAPGVIAVNAQHPHCTSNPASFEVDTYKQGEDTPKGGYAFTVVVP